MWGLVVMVHCIKCGSKLDKDDLFCPSCGSKTKEEKYKPRLEVKDKPKNRWFHFFSIIIGILAILSSFFTAAYEEEAYLFCAVIVSTFLLVTVVYLFAKKFNIWYKLIHLSVFLGLIFSGLEDDLFYLGWPFFLSLIILHLYYWFKGE